MTKQQIGRIGLIGLTVFSLLLAGNALYKKYGLDRMISGDILEVPGVVGVEILPSDKGDELTVTLDPVDDLAQTSAQLEKLGANLPIRLLDSRTPELEELYNQIQFALLEGAARGTYTEMAEYVEQKAQEAGVVTQLTMDREKIYLTLNKSGTQLVAVLEYPEFKYFLPSKGRTF